MATKKYTTLTSVKKLYQKEQAAAEKKLKSINKTLSKNQKKIAAAKKEVGKLSGSAKTKKEKLITNLTKSVATNKKQVKSAKTAVTKAKAKTKNYKHSREASKVYKDQILTKMKKSKYWGERAYIMPKYPWASTSYVFIRTNDEQPTFSSNLTSNPTEKGGTVAGSAETQPTTVAVQGVLGGDGGNSHLAGLKTQAKRLERWEKNHTPLEWHGEYTMMSTNISDFSPDYSHEIGTGGENIINLSITLQEVEYADSNKKAKAKSTKNTGTKATTKSTSTKSKKKYVIAKKGTTYWSVHVKTGVSLATIEKKNKYPATKIPVGAKIYY
ncbi:MULTISPECIES: phage baseplate protein [Levilactobacillus]|mgnify:FL=1|uniref:phage baseplate protein n=1 Tax=Levilactobacillus TaxID=2767886 RepID=UPI000A0FEF5C|nr:MULTISPECIES: hypothetical protein [Levilactobacillus]NLR32776.1 hypothetical protein [Levilactobacillus tujiorum]ORJ53928.1 hypothetical protein LBR_08335 [Levilactobacillus brevis]HJE00103.1 hypothetical protein [Levilactobacillus brevis]